MRFATEIVAYIEQHVGNMLLDRPHMYASNPEALEDVLWALDEVRRFACSAQWEHPALAPKGYGAYLQAKEKYGSANFTCHHRLDCGPELDDRELFTRLVEFWREYLRSGYATFE